MSEFTSTPANEDTARAAAGAVERVIGLDPADEHGRVVYAEIQPGGEVGVVQSATFAAEDAGLLRTLATEAKNRMVVVTGEKKPEPVPGLTALLAAAGLAGPGAMAALMPRPTVSQQKRMKASSRFLRLEAPGGLSLKTPGRNSPCPCGCGKKAKRCPAGVTG
jgi:hypothetical protein